MARKMKNIFWYSGLDKTSYDRIKPKIQKVNLIMTTTLSSFATMLISAMYISSFFGESGIMQNRSVYILGMIMSVAIFACSLTIAKSHPSIVTLLIYLSYSIYYMYGILIGTITDPSGKTVTFMVLLVFMPILFIERPIHIITVTGGYVAFFVFLCLNTKSGTVLSVDIIDAVVFGFLGCGSGIVINQMKVRGYTLEQKLHEISRIDQLTQIRNRNAYEVEKDSIPETCKISLACIYIDVNGLHEVNNEKGHEFGDKMLKFIASQVKSTLSEKFAYRIGGDEFVAFVPDKTGEQIEEAIHSLVENVEAEGYHVAVGYKVSGIRLLSLDYLISESEKKMIIDKQVYYKNMATRDARLKKNT